MPIFGLFDIAIAGVIVAVLYLMLFAFLLMLLTKGIKPSKPFADQESAVYFVDEWGHSRRVRTPRAHYNAMMQRYDRMPRIARLIVE